MPYAIQTDLERAISPEKLRQLTDDDRDGEADTAVVTKLITDADAMIDSMIGVKYATPISPTPAVLAAGSSTLSIWYAFRRRSIAAPPDVQKAYDDFIAFLKLVAEGKAVIATATQDNLEFTANRNFEKDREFRDKYDAGRTDKQKAGTFGTFGDILN